MSPSRLLRRSETLGPSEPLAKSSKLDLQCYPEVQVHGESCVFSSAVSLQHTLLFRVPRASPEEVLVIEGCLG